MKPLSAAILVASLAAIAPAHAQSYPTRPVTIIVPYPAGGPTDQVARQIDAGERIVVGVNKFATPADEGYEPLRVDPAIEAQQSDRLGTEPALDQAKLTAIPDATQAFELHHEVGEWAQLTRI